jgi:tetratricopeptide (TPR) repeat protein
VSYFGYLGITRSYYYGEHKWDSYLIDIQDAIETSSRASRRATMQAADQQISQSRQQSEALSRMSETFEAGLEEIRAEFNWGFTLMIDRMDREIKLLSHIVNKLDEIHKTLRSPLMTQARELYDLGLDRWRKGLWDKALDAFLQSEQKNDVDFPLQLQIGKLFLYGTNRDANVVNLPQAINHLKLAARYAEADSDVSLDWKRYCGQAHFHAAVAEYLTGEEQLKGGLIEEVRLTLRRALGHLESAEILWAQFTETLYLQAKCYTLLRQEAEALTRFEKLFDLDRRYYEKAKQDKDLDPILPAIEKMAAGVLANPGPLALSTVDVQRRAVAALDWAKQSPLTVDEGRQRVVPMNVELDEAKALLNSMDVDIVALNRRLSTIGREIDELTNEAFRRQLSELDAEIKSTYMKRSQCEASIQDLRRQMGLSKKGETAIGCSAGFIAWFVLCASGVMATLVGTWWPFAAVGVGIVVTVITASVVRYSRNQSLRDAVEQNRAGVEQATQLIPILQKKSSELQTQATAFSNWRSRNALG